MKLPPPALLPAGRGAASSLGNLVPPRQSDLAAEGSARSRGFASDCRGFLDAMDRVLNRSHGVNGAVALAIVGALSVSTSARARRPRSRARNR